LILTYFPKDVADSGADTYRKDFEEEGAEGARDKKGM
jgi:hypothetical protein